ncbi:MAG: GerMN domain-containing protein [Actinomycetota bacterium]|nr:GerMN domain-containing protein [Actinomycetota bacterium]
MKRRFRAGRRGIRSAVLRTAALVLASTCLAACGIADTAPAPISRRSVPFQLLDPTPPTTTTTVPPAVAVPEVIYLVGPNQLLVPERRDLPLPASYDQILAALFDGPTAAEAAVGIQSFVTGSISGDTVTVAGGIATVDFRTDPIQVVGQDQILAIAQIVYTLTAQPGISGVLFQIAGQATQVPTAAGVQISGPVTRATYAADAAPGATGSSAAPSATG